MPDISAPSASTQKDSEDQAKVALRGLVEEAVNDAQGRGQPIDYHRRRSPWLDMEYDRQFTRLNSFADALQRVEALPEVRQRYGVEAANNLALQFLYAFLDAVPDLALDEPCFESVWSRFRRELSIPEWRHVGVTILQNFTSTLRRIDIAEGIAVCIRTLEHMQGSVGQEELEWLKEDWMQGAHGSHALLVEHREFKSPDNVSRGDAFHTANKIQRALLALRLLKGGEVRTGRWFFSPPTLLPARLPGYMFPGFGFWRPGKEYRLDDSDLPVLRDYYALLGRFEQSHEDAWKNISIALRRFTAVYDNDWNQGEDKVIDAVIALEALLGTDQEITFRLSTRVAGILADSDDDRIALYKAMKLYYETRSKIVHGGELKDKNRPVLEDSSQLMDVVRRLLLGLLRLATGPSRFNSRKTISEDIDGILLHSRDREELRQAMGLI
jgi:hypothetical protein